MGIISDARAARGMGQFEAAYDFVKNPRCPFCGQTWSSDGPCGDPDSFTAGGWRAQAQRRKVREGKV